MFVLYTNFSEIFQFNHFHDSWSNLLLSRLKLFLYALLYEENKLILIQFLIVCARRPVLASQVHRAYERKTSLLQVAFHSGKENPLHPLM